MAEKRVIVDNKAIPVSDTKTSFGFGQLTNDTPTWAKNALKLTIVLTSVATFIIATDTEIAPKLALRIGVYLKALDLLVLGVSRLFGVEAK